MTAGERLRLLAGVSGTAGALLLAIGSGATAGEALVNYSGLPTGTAAVHLMTDVAPPASGGGGYYGAYYDNISRRSNRPIQLPTQHLEQAMREDAEVFSLIAHIVTKGLLT